MLSRLFISPFCSLLHQLRLIAWQCIFCKWRMSRLERLLLQLDLYCRSWLPMQVTMPTLSLLLYHCSRTICWLLLHPPWLRSFSILIISCSEEWGELSCCPFPQLLLHFLDQRCISVRIGRIHHHTVTFDRRRCLRSI